MKRLALIALVCVAACSDADVAGAYMANITNGADGCSIGWQVDEQTTAVSVTVNQADSDVTLLVNGLPGVLVASLVGTNTFTGSVSGSDLDLEVIGTVAKTSGTCEFTFNGAIDASLDGDTLTGEIEYRAATNGVAECGSRTDCVSRQRFNATRPLAP